MPDEWLIKGRNGKEVGPISSGQLKRLAANGKVNRNTLLRKSNMDRFIRASQVKGLLHHAPDVLLKTPCVGMELSASDATTPSSSPERGRIEHKLLLTFLAICICIVGAFSLSDFGSTVEDSNAAKPINQELDTAASKSMLAEEIPPMPDNQDREDRLVADTGSQGKSVPSEAQLPEPPEFPELKNPQVPVWLQRLEEHVAEEGLATYAHTKSLSRTALSKLEGEWRGVCYQYPYFVGIELQVGSIRESDNRFQGALKLFHYATQEGSKQKSFTLKSEGRASGTVRPDTSELQIRSIQSGQDDHETEVMLRGVVATKPMEIGGEALSGIRATTGFFLRRKNAGLDSWDQAIALMELRKRIRYEMSRRVIAAPAPAQYLTSFKEWASRFSEEYPNVDLLHTDTDELHPMVTNLFEDALFSRYFGKPFDELEAVESLAIHSLLERARRGKYGDMARETVAGCLGLTRCFWIGGSQDAIDTIARMWPRRILRRWRDQQSRRLRRSEVSLALGHEIEFLNRSWRRHSANLFPSEQNLDLDEITAKYEQFRYEIAPSTLAKQISETIAYRPPSGASVENVISHLEKATGALMHKVKASALEADRKRDIELLLQSHSSYVCWAYCKSKIPELLELDPTLSSIETLSEIQASASALQRFAESSAPHLFAKFESYLGELRSLLLAKSRSTIIELVEEANSINKVESIRQTIFPNSSEPKNEPELEIVQALEAKTFEIELAERKAFYSDFELEHMLPGGTIEVPRDYPSPTIAEIRLAYLRSHSPMKGRMATPYTYESTKYVISPVWLFQKLPTWVLLRINDVDIEHSTATSWNGRLAYEVRFRLKAEHYVFTPFDDSSPVPAALNRLTEYTESVWSDSLKETFEFTEDGWMCPSFEQSIRESEAYQMGAAYNALLGDRPLPFAELTDRFPDGIPDLIEMADAQKRR